MLTIRITACALCASVALAVFLGNAGAQTKVALGGPDTTQRSSALAKTKLPKTPKAPVYGSKSAKVTRMTHDADFEYFRAKTRDRQSSFDEADALFGRRSKR